MRQILAFLAFSSFALQALAAEPDPRLPDGPDFKDVLSLDTASRPRLSPDGETIAYVVTSTDWENNRYDSEIYVARRGREPFQLTRTRDKSSSDPKWSPDSRWIAFKADRGDGPQVHLIRAAGGEAFPLTAVKDGVGSFEWSPGGRFMALLITAPKTESSERREELFGKFAFEDADFRMRHLWLLDVKKAMESDGGVELPPEKDEAAEKEDGGGEMDEGGEGEAIRRLTGGEDFTVSNFAFSPDGTQIAFTHQPDPLINSFDKSDISVLDVESGRSRPLVERSGFDTDPIYSPDGKWILFETSDGKTAYYANSELARVPAAGGEVELLTAGFDENPSGVDWLDDGIRFTAFRKTHRQLFHLDPENGEIRPLTDEPPVIRGVDYSADGREMALSGSSGTKLSEIYRCSWPADGGRCRLTQVTAMTDQVDGWPQPGHEVVEWTSRDGARIEGVLFKPADFEPGRRYPLLVIIHGGPTAVSVPQRVSSYVYPVVQWLAKGAVVLMPNYRGSAGYGAEFRALNVRNLGVGDAWDVLSGVDYLVDRGIADEERLGAMGWSQGGYISAFLTTTSDRFKAVSVGAGISDWMTYYVNTDIHPFTRHYLEATPWDDPEIYDKTSPIHYVRQAGTPTLIQHGELDRRVPIPNAYELYQGLKDVGVDARLVVYKGFGHGIDKPKERLAAVWHNWQWFAEHIWGEEVELPAE